MQQGPARRSTAGQAAQDGGGWKSQGFPRAQGLGTVGLGKRGEDDCKRHFTGAQACDKPLRRARRLRDHAGVGWVERAYLLAIAGWCNGRWDGRELEMTSGCV